MRPLALILLTTLSASAQRLTVVIDPARGGNEYGARIDSKSYEKQVTLDLANRLRSLLNARDFNVVLTRESDTAVTNEQRASIANTSKPIACLLLHATSSGTGLHLWTSSLTPAPANSPVVLWDEAQAPFVDRSQRLSAELAGAFSRSRIPVSSGHTWIRPLDNMQCPAIAIEIAPRDSSTDAADHSYGTRIVDAIANSLLVWRNHADIMQSITNPAPPPATAPKPEANKASGSAGTTGTSAVKPAGPVTTPAASTTGTAKPNPTSSLRPERSGAEKPASPSLPRQSTTPNATNPARLRTGDAAAPAPAVTPRTKPGIAPTPAPQQEPPQ